MNKYQKYTRLLAKGFTLIELLVVVVIIGVLISVGIIGISSSSDSETQKLSADFMNTVVKLRHASILNNKAYRLILFKNKIEVLQYQKKTATQHGSPDFVDDAGKDTTDYDIPQNWTKYTNNIKPIQWDRQKIEVVFTKGSDDFLDEYEFQLNSYFDKGFTDLVIFWSSGSLSADGKLQFKNLNNDADNITVKWQVHGVVGIE